MRVKTHRSIALHVADAAQRQAVQQEIESFLQALSSHPDQFAHDPYLSFEKHLCSIMAEDQPPAEMTIGVA